MKSICKRLFSLLAAASLFAVVPFAHAADAVASTTEMPTKTHKSPAMHQTSLKHLRTELSLTDDQATKIKPILKDESVKIKALKADVTLSDDQKKAKYQEIIKSTHDQITPLLTADQQQKFSEVKAASTGSKKKTTA
ncbi:MAG TPA: hypothetical protein VKC60_14210 [Opitutaceae bacterium]|nr:hypothetical protein [Opitutaceae bacterium]